MRRIFQKFQRTGPNPNNGCGRASRRGETADLNARDRNDDPAFEDLDPMEANGWTQNRRLRVKFLQTILFYGHKLVGWVLGSFIVAGLAGTTQRERD